MRILAVVVIMVLAAGLGAEGMSSGGIAGRLRQRGTPGRSEDPKRAARAGGRDGGGRPGAGAGGGGLVRGHFIDGAKNMVASAVASAVGKGLLQPFDSIKTVQQNTHTHRLGMIAAAAELLSRGGALALYSGLWATIAGSVPSIAIYFGCYQFFKGQFMDALGRQGAIAAAAGLANLIAAVVRVPFEIVKQRIQAGMYESSVEAVLGMYRVGGIGAFFIAQGLVSQVARDIPYAIVTLLAYEAMQAAASKRAAAKAEKDGREAKSSVLVSLLTGALAGGLGTLVTTPMDVVKTRLMVSPHLYNGYLSAVVTTFKEEGAGAFMKGAIPRLIHKMPANSVFFVVYEAVRRLLAVKT